MSEHSNGDGEMRVLMVDRPSSFDPYTYDYFKHHPIQSIVNIKLFTNYKDARLQPQLAKSWTSSNSNAEWRFKIRDDISFRDGTKLSPQIVVANLRRMVFLLRSTQSKNDLINSLVDLDSISSPSPESFKGIVVEGEEVVFRFRVPYAKVLDSLSFGLFAIVHPKYFRLDTGEWLHHLKDDYDGAGSYSPKSISENEQIYELKSDYPSDQVAIKPFRKIKVFFDKKAASSADIFVAPADSKLASPKHRYHGIGDVNTMYMSCHPWALPSSPLSSIGKRREIRDALYAGLHAVGVRVTRSFFPLVMSGISEPRATADVPTMSPRAAAEEISFNELRPSGSELVDKVLDRLEAALSSLGYLPKGVRNLRFEELVENQDPKRSKYSVDIGFYVTSIDVTDPVGDVKLMFSKEGIRLPDKTNDIHLELVKENFSIQRINELLFEQAIIWPVSQYSKGLWTSERLDLSSYNTHLPLGELQWIGAK